MVNLRLIQPQEVEVLYVLPAIRKELAIQMKLQGKDQKEIAKLLSVTEAAVSQYLKSKRASKIEFKNDILKEISLSAKKITDISTMLIETQRILSIVKKTGFLCKVHRKLVDLPTKCCECFNS
jgi:uncharacterized protein